MNIVDVVEESEFLYFFRGWLLVLVMVMVTGAAMMKLISVTRCHEVSRTRSSHQTKAVLEQAFTF